mgnify:FL=1
MTRAGRFLAAALVVAGCALREAPSSRSGSPLVEVLTADASAFPAITVELAAPSAITPGEFHAGRPAGGPLDRGVSVERVEPAGAGRWRIVLRDGDVDPDRIERRLAVGYSRDAPPYSGSRSEVSYRPDPALVRAEFDRELPALLAELAGATDLDRARGLADALARHAPDRPELAAFDRRHGEGLLAEGRDRDALSLARRLTRPELAPLLAGRARALLGARAESTALDWLAWLARAHPHAPPVEPLAGSFRDALV